MKVEKSCVTFLLWDPGWCVHKSDVQNIWDDNTQHSITRCAYATINIKEEYNYNSIKCREEFLGKI